ncbi:SWR1-complex protein [Verticillium alfalfae VaMs.102]|uniref:SWR1-complex protein n=1 Tax=Verticillium alfalfae (strain VaMs.102 / ATCC MYA-4576 / FGSC 10136) TaxID=526221 RepID=C9SGI8_VERA1|nr:SWR1-complex protein [Verticillium alfalfae VaMs.102]EEY18138.1 SWR1-complex protein [Verticillium alfalfae VaMs.102]
MCMCAQDTIWRVEYEIEVLPLKRRCSGESVEATGDPAKPWLRELPRDLRGTLDPDPTIDPHSIIDTFLSLSLFLSSSQWRPATSATSSTSTHTPGPGQPRKLKTAASRPNLKGGGGGKSRTSAATTPSPSSPRSPSSRSDASPSGNPAARWELRAFQNSSRGDDGAFVLRHWRRKTDGDDNAARPAAAPHAQGDAAAPTEPKAQEHKREQVLEDSAFAKYNVHVDVPQYSPDQYQTNLMMSAQTPVQYMTKEEFALHETMLNFNPQQERVRKEFAVNGLSGTKEEANEEESLLVEIKRILARSSVFNEERRELYNRLDYPHTDQDINAFKSSTGLQTLLQNMMAVDKNKKRKSLMGADGVSPGAPGQQQAGAGAAAACISADDNGDNDGDEPVKANKKADRHGDAASEEPAAAAAAASVETNEEKASPAKAARPPSSSGPHKRSASVLSGVSDKSAKRLKK